MKVALAELRRGAGLAAGGGGGCARRLCGTSPDLAVELMVRDSGRFIMDDTSFGKVTIDAYGNKTVPLGLSKTLRENMDRYRKRGV